MISYDFPLNERIRTLLRMEALYERVRFFTSKDQPLEHHAALLSLFEILDVAGRADLKSEMMQELERQKQTLSALRSNPAISEEALNSVLSDIDRAVSELFQSSGKTGQGLRENEWLMGIKQRSAIPGGVCEFDLPSYHYWLHRPSEERTGQLAAWTGPLHPLRDGTAIILRILRESGKAQSLAAPLGTFQQMLGGTTAQMLRVRLEPGLPCVPEISANKYVLNIRFLAQNGEETRAKTADWDVGFDLTFCNL